LKFDFCQAARHGIVPAMMIKPAKKRKGDAVQVAYSVMQAVTALSNKPIVAPPLKKPKKKR